MGQVIDLSEDYKKWKISVGTVIATGDPVRLSMPIQVIDTEICGWVTPGAKLSEIDISAIYIEREVVKENETYRYTMRQKADEICTWTLTTSEGGKSAVIQVKRPAPWEPPDRIAQAEFVSVMPPGPVWRPPKLGDLAALAKFQVVLAYILTRAEDRCKVTTQPTNSIPDPIVELDPSPSSLSDSRIDFVLVTALPEEREAVLEKLPGYSLVPPAKDDIRTYFRADLPVTFPNSSTGKYRVVVMCLLGMGRVQAVAATVDAIRRWHPRYIVLIGIAGGIAARNIQIGDILIPDQVVDYELQKLTPEGPEVRWDVQRADARLLNACNNFRSESWRKLIKIKRPDRGKPNVHTGPIASGDKVIAFNDVLARYRDVWPKLLGVEMEAAGVATAAFQSSDRPGFFMVRGVSDLADENKGSSDVGKWRSYACDAAASFAIALLKSGPVPLSEGDEVPHRAHRAGM
jgi:nucleoside phosphorylase